MDNIGVVAFLVAFLAIIFLAVWKIQDIVAGALKPKERYQLPHITERDPTHPARRPSQGTRRAMWMARRNGWRRRFEPLYMWRYHHVITSYNAADVSPESIYNIKDWEQK